MIGGIGKYLYNGNKSLSMRVELPMVKAAMRVGKISLKSGKISLEGSIPLNFECASTADCCSKLQIPVTDFDIKRIEDRSFALDQIVKDLVPQLRLPKTKYGSIEKNYWIKRKPFTNVCTFLQDKKCRIHDFKPFGCRIFPFSLKYLSTEEVLVKIHPSNLCKTVKRVSEADSNNLEQLETIYREIIREEKFRDEYFAKYGDQI